MSNENIKVSELPEEEQKELIAEAYAVGLQGTFNGWKVETLKNKIADAKAKKEGEGDDEQKGDEDEQNGSNDEQNGGDDEQNDENVNEEEIAKEEPKKESKKQPKKAEVKSEGICHICRSKVVNGVCTGCGFHK